MATHHTREEAEKENEPHMIPETPKKTANKRTNFAVINSVSQRVEGFPGNITFRNVQIKEVQNIPGTSRGVKIQKPNPTPSTVPDEQAKCTEISSEDGKDRQDPGNKIDSVPSTSTSDCAISDPAADVPSTSGVVFKRPTPVDDAISPLAVDNPSGNDRNKQICLSPAENDLNNFFEVQEYQWDILAYLKEVEMKYLPEPAFGISGSVLNYSPRTILIDWLVEVADEYRLHNETLYLAVSYINQFLSIKYVTRGKLQLVGIGAMLIAAKHEENFAPEPDDFVYITDDTYSKEQLLRMERDILKVLKFKLCAPTEIVFISLYTVLHKMPNEVKFLAMYFTELSLLIGDCYIKYLPSQIASAALALARHLLGFPIWCRELKQITTYSVQSLKAIILQLCRIHNLSTGIPQQAIQRKYKTDEYNEVGTIAPIQLNERKLEKIFRAYHTMRHISDIKNAHSARRQ